MVELLHIHHHPGEVCIACGDLDVAPNRFVTDPGYWNQQVDRCDTTKMVRPDYVLFARDDPRTSALASERLPSRKRTGELP